MRAIEAGDDDPAGLISAWLENHIGRSAEIHRFVKIALDYKGSPERDPAVEATIAKFYAKERELLSRFIRLGIEQGRFKRVDAGRMAQFISTYLDGCMVRMVILSDFPLKSAVGDLHRFVLDLLACEEQPIFAKTTLISFFRTSGSVRSLFRRNIFLRLRILIID